MIQAKKTSVKSFGAQASAPAGKTSAPAPAGSRHRMMESPLMQKDPYGRPPEITVYPAQFGIVDHADDKRYSAAQRAGADIINERTKSERARIRDVADRADRREYA